MHAKFAKHRSSSSGHILITRTIFPQIVKSCLSMTAYFCLLGIFLFLCFILPSLRKKEKIVTRDVYGTTVGQTNRQYHTKRRPARQTYRNIKDYEFWNLEFTFR